MLSPSPAGTPQPSPKSQPDHAAMAVDCRSLIDFCRAFDPHRVSSPRPIYNKRPHCPHSLSPTATFLDLILLLAVLTSLAVLTLPYLQLLTHLLPLTYTLPLALLLALAISLYEVVSHQCRKCASPYCKGLKKAVEFDIQLESEECVRCLPPSPKDGRVELGEECKELEAELRRMAPLNGRTVLIFRARCGCPAGRMEVWGAKKVRRIKK